METIVKVQLSLYSSDGRRMVLMYDKNKKNYYEGPATKEIVKAMDGEDKKYFWAKIPKKPGIIELYEEAPEQDW